MNKMIIKPMEKGRIETCLRECDPSKLGTVSFCAKAA